MALDIARLRAETPGADRILHLNHAGSSLMSAPTIAAVQAQLRREAEGGSMEAGSAAAVALDQVRADAAELLNAAADEIAFTGGNSDGWGRAFAALRLKPGDKVLVEYRVIYKLGLEVKSITNLRRIIKNEIKEV